MIIFTLWIYYKAPIRAFTFLRLPSFVSTPISIHTFTGCLSTLDLTIIHIRHALNKDRYKEENKKLEWSFSSHSPSIHPPSHYKKARQANSQFPHSSCRLFISFDIRILHPRIHFLAPTPPTPALKHHRQTSNARFLPIPCSTWTPNQPSTPKMVNKKHENTQR